LTRRLSSQQQSNEDAAMDVAVVGGHLAASNLPSGITFEALKAQLTKHDGLLQNLSISIDRWLVPPKPKRASSDCGRILSKKMPHQMSVPYVRNNFQFLTFSLTFILVNVGLFVSRSVDYWHFKNADGSRNWCILLARACGQCLNFTSMFLLVLMLRHSITKLREFGLNILLPLDRHIYFHKVTGRLVLVYGVLHTLAHLGNIGEQLFFLAFARTKKWPKFDPLFIASVQFWRA